MAAAAFSFLGRLVRMPSIVGSLLAGMLLGPGLGLVELNESLLRISELGIMLLLFLVGLELSLQKIRDLGGVALLLGGLQVVLTALGGFALAHLLGFNTAESAFLAAAVTFSSTVVVIKLLDQKGAMDQLYGRLTLGLLLVQDMVVILALTFLNGLSGGEVPGFAALVPQLSLAFGGMAVLLAVTLLASRYVLPRPFAWIAKTPEAMSIWALCWCFLVVLLAEQFHLSLEIGAFLAGIALAQLPVNEDLYRRLHPLMNFFIAVFLVTLGVRMELGGMGALLPAALGLSAFVLLAKPLVVLLILRRLGFGGKTSLRTALASGQVSEFAFILLALGINAGLIGSAVGSLGGLVGIITISVSSFLMLNDERIHGFLERTGLLRAGGGREEVAGGEERAGHVVVVGMNALGREIVRSFNDRGQPVVAVDTDPGKLTGLEPAETFIGSVEYESVIREIGLTRARLVVSALQIEDANHLLAYRCRDAGVPCAIHAFDVSVVDDLVDLETDYLLTPALDGAVRQREMLKEEGILRA